MTSNDTQSQYQEDIEDYSQSEDEENSSADEVR
jgi:hypothetical protein